MMCSPNWYRELLRSVRWPFWFACFWAAAGVFWRDPFSSVLLISVFLLLLVAVVRLPRRWEIRQLQRIKIADTGAVNAESMDADAVDGVIHQQLIRSRTSAGQERLDGTFWAEFPPGTMTVTVHIPFCPPFAGVPKVQVYPIDDSGVHVRIVLPKPYGVRIDVKQNHRHKDRICLAMIAEE